MKVLSEYRNSHHYIYNYEKNDIYCPRCGSLGSVWEEDGEGDYYCGPENLCDHCGYSFTIQGLADSDLNDSKVRQIKSGVMDTPKTKAGS